MLGTPNGQIQQKLTGGYTATIQVPTSPETLQQLAQDDRRPVLHRRVNDSRVRDVYKRLGSRLGHRTINREMTDVFGGVAALLLLLGGGMSALWFRRVVP